MTLPGLASCIDRVATRFAGIPHEGEIERAREAFDARRGRIYDDDELFPMHMSAFLEWFVLERPIPTQGAPGEEETPAVQAIREKSLSPEDETLMRALAVSHRSLFEVLEPGGVLLFDLILGGQWRVDLDRPLDGIGPGDIFEARLIPWEGEVRYGPAFLFHPRDARPHILSLLEQAEGAQGLGVEVICTLAEMRLRHSRFRNIPVERIYTRPGQQVQR